MIHKNNVFRVKILNGIFARAIAAITKMAAAQLFFRWHSCRARVDYVINVARTMSTYV